jgi:hypothetical protein
MIIRNQYVNWVSNLDHEQYHKNCTIYLMTSLEEPKYISYKFVP